MMGIYLNPGSKKFQIVRQSEIYVDERFRQNPKFHKMYVLNGHLARCRILCAVFRLNQCFLRYPIPIISLRNSKAYPRHH